MKKKTAPAIKVLAYEIKTSMKTLLSDVGNLNREIFKVAVDSGLHPTGPQFWIYKWKHENPNPEAEFTLNICLPVATFGANYKGESFKLIQLEPYSHLAIEHLGSWANLSSTYGKLMSEMHQQSLIPGKTCRELYINCDFENPDNNITEVQFEVI